MFMNMPCLAVSMGLGNGTKHSISLQIKNDWSYKAGNGLSVQSM